MLTPQLNEAIEGLYATFSGYSLPEDTQPCPCCHSREDEARLRAKPLRKLECEHLNNYVWDALTTWGDEQTFRHLLPRIFELLVLSPKFRETYADPEIVLNKLHYGNWREWPEAEQRAVERYLHALFDWVLGEPPPEGACPDVEDWFCGVGQCEDDLTSYLDQWIADERSSAALALTSLLLTSAVTQRKKQGRSPFWDRRDAQYEQLRRWVKSPDVIRKLSEAEVANAGNAMAAEFAAARAMCEGD